MSSTDPVPRKTGLQHVDLFVAGCALLVSVVSLFVAWQANRTQERMLAASVWPYLSWGTSNVTGEDQQRDEISFNLFNLGVGPARLQSLQLFYKNQPVSDAQALLQACCGAQLPAAGWELRTATVNPLVLPGHDNFKFLSLPKNQVNAAMWQALDRERHNITLGLCYCSVLEQCWALRSGQEQPQEVARCEMPKGQYH
jgi:hypothetical protein